MSFCVEEFSHSLLALRSNNIVVNSLSYTTLLLSLFIVILVDFGDEMGEPDLCCNKLDLLPNFEFNLSILSIL